MSTEDQVAAAAQETRRVRVHRFKRDDGPAHVDEHAVPVDARTTVLEALRWIQLHDDPTLALRHSCFHASCGTCGVRVNGRERLACVTPLADVGGGTVTVEPIANLPVLNDLVVDMTSFVERFPEAHAIVRDSEFLPEADVPDDLGATCGSRTASNAGSVCPPARWRRPMTATSAPRPSRSPSGCWRRTPAPSTATRCSTGRTRTSPRGAAMPRSSAPRPVPSNVRPAQRIMALRKDLRRRRRDQGRAVPEVGSEDPT